MEQVVIYDSSKIISAFRECAERVKTTNFFQIDEFIKLMEPIFRESGYRRQSQITCYLERHKTKILILHDAGAGDFIISSGVIREIRRIYPDAYIVLLVKSHISVLAEFCPYVDEIILNEGKFSYSNFHEMFEDYIELASSFLKRNFDVCYSLAYIAESQLLMYMSGARIRISLDVYVNETDERSFSNVKFFNFKNTAKFSTYCISRPKYHCHRVDMAFHMLEIFLHTPISNRGLEVWYSPLEMTVAQSLLENVGRPVYALCMGGSHQRKMYPPEKYAKFIEMIVTEEKNVTFAILGAGNNDLKSAEILKNIIPEIYDKNILDLTDKINYRQSAAILKLCNAYVGNDTGTKHLAAAVNCPVMEINCYPADLPLTTGDSISVYYPYGVPNVIIRPTRALPECSREKSHNSYGCRIVNKPHCITQIKPQILFDGLKYLKKRVAEKNFKPLYVCE
ncbi:MAG: glycosyltransferase family 9 protein [Selenomonadaceae bacterium]|nr:glycosyltransferase family 9 protein [Selenomonadaceae bacterium]